MSQFLIINFFTYIFLHIYICHWMHSVCLLSRAQLFATPWTVAHQAPLSIEFFRQEHWSGLPYPSLGDLSDSGIKPTSSVAPALACRFFTTKPLGKIFIYIYIYPVNSVSLKNTNKIVKIK